MKINTAKISELDKVISEVEGKSSKRTINADEVLRLIKKIEETLSVIAPKSEWVGSEFKVTTGGKVASSYFGTANATFVAIKRFTSGWFVTDVERSPLKSRDIYPVRLPKLSKSHRHQISIFN